MAIYAKHRIAPNVFHSKPSAKQAVLFAGMYVNLLGQQHPGDQALVVVPLMCVAGRFSLGPSYFAVALLQSHFRSGFLGLYIYSFPF